MTPFGTVPGRAYIEPGMNEIASGQPETPLPHDHPVVAALLDAVRATRDRRWVDALDQFEDNLDASVLQNAPQARARFLSYYAVCQAMVSARTRRALSLCETALGTCGPEADLWLNLGLVRLRARQRDLAREAFMEGLRLAPGHPELLMTLQRLRRRRPPVFRFLPRGHPLNRISGRVLTRLRGLVSAESSEPERGP